MDCDFYVFQMTNGKNKEFNDLDHEAEVEEFFEDNEAYWKKRGWHIITKDGKQTLTPIPA